MEESIVFGWSVNSSDELRNPQFQISQSPSLDEIFRQEQHATIGYPSSPRPITNPLMRSFSNGDPFGFLEGHMINQPNNNLSSYNNHYNSKSISSNFGENPQPKDCSGDLNLISDCLVERYEAFSCNKRRLQGNKMVSKGFVSPQNRDHIIAERKRREKLNQRFIELSSIIPYLKKSDKASILIDAVKYVKELQTKVKTLESENPKPIDTVVLVKTSSLSSDDAHDKISSSNCTKPLPEIHAKLSENSVLISIHCENAKGVLVKILSEIEELNFMITQTNLIPFAGSTIFITITAQVEESCSITMEDVVRKIDSTLNQFKSTTKRKFMDGN